MLRIAIIGCGHHGAYAHGAPLARFVKNHPGRVELAAACDVNPTRAAEFAREFGFTRSYADYNAMLSEERIDLCHCVVPPPLTPDVAASVMERKIPCVVEKPMGCNRGSMARLIEAAHRTGTPHIVSVNRRFMPHLNLGKKWAMEQGPLQYLRAAMMRSGRREPSFSFSTAMHSIDAARHLMGDVDSFTCNMQTSPAIAREWQHIDFKFSSGALGRLDTLPTTGFEEEVYEICGEDFLARIVSYMRGGTSVTCYLKNERVLHETSDGQGEDIFRGEYAEVEDFITALETGKKPSPTVDDIAPSMNICFSIAEQAGNITCD